MPINPFEAGAPSMVNAIPPDIYNLEWLARVSPIAVAAVYGLCAVVAVSIYCRRRYGG